MKRFYIITNRTKDKDLAVTKNIKAYIESKGGECFSAEEYTYMPDGIDCILVLGGDGTLIRAARELPSSDVPMLGINMGTLGYLTEVEVSDMEKSIDQLMEGNSYVEKRMLLHGCIEGKDESLALNDIVLTRSGNVRVMQFHVYVNGELLNTYRADGVIVSTPTGSTAYNLSAGGPIVAPTASLIVLEVGVGRDGSEEEAVVSFDGEKDVIVRTGDKIQIRKAEATAKLLKLSKISFLEIMRRKMKGN